MKRAVHTIEEKAIIILRGTHRQNVQKVHPEVTVLRSGVTLHREVQLPLKEVLLRQEDQAAAREAVEMIEEGNKNEKIYFNLGGFRIIIFYAGLLYGYLDARCANAG